MSDKLDLDTILAFAIQLALDVRLLASRPSAQFLTDFLI